MWINIYMYIYIFICVYVCALSLWDWPSDKRVGHSGVRQKGLKQNKVRQNSPQRLQINKWPICRLEQRLLTCDMTHLKV